MFTKHELKNAVVSFLDLINWSVEINFLGRTEYFKTIGDDSVMAVGDDGLTLNVERVIIGSIDRIKMSLLHECGHTHHEEDAGLNEGEYQAHIWALGKAYQLVSENKESPSLVHAVKKAILDWGKDPPSPEYKYVHDRVVAENLI